MKTCPNCIDSDGESLELSYDMIEPKNHWENWHCFECGYDLQGSQYLGYEVTNRGKAKNIRDLINKVRELYD